MIKKVKERDLQILSRLAVLMWSDYSVDQLTEKFLEIMRKNNQLFLLKYVSEEAVGFAQHQLRYDYVEGTKTSPVGYLEGIFVKEEFRNLGYAEELLKNCEKWAKEKGCSEFASDCELSNTMSLKFHNSLKFREANRIICFTKKI